jgi:hypothetical protein
LVSVFVPKRKINWSIQMKTNQSSIMEKLSTDASFLKLRLLLIQYSDNRKSFFRHFFKDVMI